MALKATIFKATLQVSDMDRHYYGEHALTLARHPSETDERMMVRVLAFALNAHEHLAFGKGLSEADEPDLWQKDLTGAVVHWIDVGQPDERRLIRASGRAERVSVYAYGSRAETWWGANAERLARAGNLAAWRVPAQACDALSKFAARSMRLHCAIQDRQVLFGDATDSVEIRVLALQAAAG